MDPVPGQAGYPHKHRKNKRDLPMLGNGEQEENGNENQTGQRETGLGRMDGGRQEFGCQWWRFMAGLVEQKKCCSYFVPMHR